MIRKHHDGKLQANQRHREEEPHNNHETQGRQTKQNNKLSLPQQDDCKSRMDTKSCTLKESRNGSNTLQLINNNRTTALEWTPAKTMGGGFYWYKIFVLDSAVVKT